MSPLPSKFLIIQTAFIGDVILTLPTLQALKQHFPDSEIDFLAIPAAQNLLETHPALSRLLVYDKHGADRGVAAFLRLAHTLRRRRYDAVIAPHRSLRSALLAWRSGSRRRIGFDRSAGRFLLSEVVPYPPNLHEIDRNLRLLAPLGLDPEAGRLPEIHFTREDHTAVNFWMEQQGISRLRRICLAPGSVWATKRWLPERFAELAGRLTHEGYAVVLVGGAAYQEITRQVAKTAGAPLYNAAGRFTLRQSAALLQAADLLISNDSAPMHLAVAVKTPVLAIFGATAPALGFYPYGEHDRVIEDKQLACRPCGSHGGHKCPIGSFDCMRNISVENVFKQTLEMLDKADVE